jgi:ATP-dependent DNA helicase DinG
MLLLNAPLVAARLGYPELSGLDLLELFAFVHPARFLVPTPRGLADALGLPRPEGLAADAAFLRDVATHLLATLGQADWPERAGAYDHARQLWRLRWPWGAEVASRIARPEPTERSLFDRLPKWEEAPPRPKPRDVTVEAPRVSRRLAELVGSDAEDRPGQRDYAQAAAFAFRPRSVAGAPNIALAEGGTGIGKTLGYLAPASVWADEAGGAVWLSTYTKALQRQLVRETARIYPASERADRVVIRKGRENYLCLLNLEDALQGGFSGRAATLAQLVARWAAYSRDGDMIGGDLPGWLASLFGRNAIGALSDRRGECVFAGCPHYRRCFIERSARASEGARLVVANHALVMANAARERTEAAQLTRIVFDEGHHLFDAADSTFALALTGAEAIELRRWLIGPEGRSRGRRRGLAARLSELAAEDEAGAAALDLLLQTSRLLPSDGWLARVVEGVPSGPVEGLLAAVRTQVYARASAQEAGYGLETEAAELLPVVVEAAGQTAAALEQLLTPMAALGARLEAVLEESPGWLDTAARARLEGARSGLRLRAAVVSSWIALLARLGGASDPDFVDWLAVERHEGREYDVGIRRHWLDPTRPLAEAVLSRAHGVLITSATLRSRIATGPETGWRDCETRTGATHLPLPPHRFSAASPFDYAAQSRVLVVTDVKRGDIPALAGAYRALIDAAGGGTLGLFTAISRLKAVHARIADALARSGLDVYAQHVDPVDAGTLVDIFRAEPHSSLLGTDALRDGVDVPGHALRLVILEGVPWPRPTVLHAARRAAFGGKAYDDLVTGGRLAQAFGRLIRSTRDRGVFVLLGSAVPSRLLAALPEGTAVERVSLAQAVAVTRTQVAAQLSDWSPADVRASVSKPR